ncbi:NrsF family protein [Rhodopseudomonas sp. NSM]|uniref:NrsF family protein n=1 Tax=Rhodopseudomonas sp. NSM TaxID=3457630 RepID=UPI0040375E08
MDTDQFINTLAADSAQRERPVGQVLAAALLVALPVSAAMLLSTLGLRSDIATAFGNPFFNLKFVVTLALVLSAITVALHLSRPEATARSWRLLLLAPLAILGLAIGGEAMLPHRTSMMTRLVGHNAMQCLTAIPVVSLPLLIAALIGLRRGAPANPTLAGALAGMIAAGLAATLYAAHCVDDSPLFVATWYTLATGIVAAIGAVAGSRVLRY